jgi:ferredoxin-NADP reductase
MTTTSTANPARTTYEAKIERILDHTPDTRSFFLRLVDRQRLTFLPGQFLSFQLLVGGETLTRPYSIASSPEENDLLEICLNLVPGGLGSQYLFAREVGDPLHFTGPWGTFVLDQPPEAECVFIADGTGIAPIRPMLRRALTSFSRSFPVRLLYSAPSERDLLYCEEWGTWEKQCDRFIFTPLLNYPPKGWQGLHEPLVEYVHNHYTLRDKDRSRHFYICGVGQQVTQLRDFLRRAGYQRRAVQYEKW